MNLSVRQMTEWRVTNRKTKRPARRLSRKATAGEKVKIDVRGGKGHLATHWVWKVGETEEPKRT
jgi:hypothetical protein